MYIIKGNNINDFNGQIPFNGYETFNKPKNEDDCPNNEITNQIINKSNEGKETKIILNELPKTRESNQEKEITNNLKQIKENNLLVVEENLKEQNNKEIKKSKSKLGRKKNNSSEKGKHTKYSTDNIFKKIKASVLDSLYPVINRNINHVYNGNIGQGIFKKVLLKIKQDQILNSKNDHFFINKMIKDILSDDISNRFSNYPSDHNKRLIEELLNEEDEEKRTIFKKLLELTFNDVLKHFRGTQYFIELKGLDNLNKVCEKFGNDEDYLKLFKHYVFNFEKEIERKRKKI